MTTTEARVEQETWEGEEHVRLKDRIAERAYAISLGPDSGDDVENWLRAERELTDDI